MISTHVCYVAFGDILSDCSMAVVIGAFRVLAGWRVHDFTSAVCMSFCFVYCALYTSNAYV